MFRSVLLRRLNYQSSRTSGAVLALAGSALISHHVSSAKANQTLQCEDARKQHQDKFYTADEVATRNGQNGAETWVTLGDRVYNITDFVKEHKGGDLIRTAAGGPIEDYWAYWAYHLTLEEPQNVLKQHEIGRLKYDDDDDDEDDSARETLQEKLVDNYESDPDRDQSVRHGQHPCTVRPWCSETDPKKQQTLYTDNRSFYVRNHAPVPRLSFEDHELTISAHKADKDSGDAQDDPESDNEVTLSLSSLGKRYPLAYVSSALQCAGNRTKELRKIAPTAFEHTPFRDIDRGMIGNALWSGYRLSEVLKDLFPWLEELSAEELQGWHVEFEGVDQYRTSTPLARILDPSNDCLLAVGMNGEELPADHGFPCRVLLPGIAGARQVKWVHNIRVSQKECDSCFQTTYYLDPHGKAIQEMPLQSFLTAKEKVDDKGTWRVHGVAWGGSSGVGVGTIELSSDQGKTWTSVPMSDWQTSSNGASLVGNKEWSWVVFETNILAKSLNPTFLCRITDKSGVQQPQMIWYPKGYLSNPWHEL